MTISPLAPEHFPDLPSIAGIGLATAASGMRYKGRDDLLLITLAAGSTVAGVFTQSDTAAAPVIWSRNIADTGQATAIITKMVKKIANHIGRANPKTFAIQPLSDMKSKRAKAAKRHKTPWEKLKTPEALKIRTKPRATKAYITPAMSPANQ
ncbi:MAG: hypothetical protein EBY34_00630 [Alphaproteobacteria bacterium]|nr:hypothetical protein [Alphaproteobacteria bacterium]NDG36222.1 hypothetical protein [Alphaproteobacteria bacterium]